MYNITYIYVYLWSILFFQIADNLKHYKYKIIQNENIRIMVYHTKRIIKNFLKFLH